MHSVTANDLKTRGVAAIEESLANSTEAVVSVRGKDRFVVMDMAQYNYLRECELDAAVAQSRADFAAGRFVTESAQQHMERMDALLASGGAGAALKKTAVGKTVVKKAAAQGPASKKAPAKQAARKAARR